MSFAITEEEIDLNCFEKFLQYIDRNNKYKKNQKEFYIGYWTDSGIDYTEVSNHLMFVCFYDFKKHAKSKKFFDVKDMATEFINDKILSTEYRRFRDNEYIRN